MFYEVSRYRLLGNGSHPRCITGVLNWVHGTYEFLPNGSLVLEPMGDGYQQIQANCAAQSNFVEFYNQSELYITWNVVQDPSLGPRLYLWQFDGVQLAPMSRVSEQPNMLPTQLLRNVTSSQLVNQDGFVATGQKKIVKRSGAESVLNKRSVTATAGVLGVAALVLTLL